MSCLYTTCVAAARSAAPIKSLHVMVLCNIQCHSAARYIPATTHRDTALNVNVYGTRQRRLEVWLDHVVAQRAARAACAGMSIISA